MTNIAATEGWSHPASLSAEIESKDGLPGPGSPWGGYSRGWFDLDTVTEICDMENAFYADAAAYLMKNKPWELFMLHAHAPDHMYHHISNALNNPDLEARKPFEEAELKIYKSLDEMCLQIFGCADESTLTAMVSDHGAKPTTTLFSANPVLRQAGLLVQDEKGTIDWSKTKAYTEAASQIYINVKGRDPRGIVEPGEEYYRVQEEIINYLHEYTDPISGKKPIIMALRKEDARVIGMHGDWVGDVICSISRDFGDQHGAHLATTSYGMGDLRGLFALSGPNIKNGVELERTVWVQDLVPTICYLTGWPVPAQAEGAVVYQAMEDPNAR